MSRAPKCVVDVVVVVVVVVDCDENGDVNA